MEEEKKPRGRKPKAETESKKETKKDPVLAKGNASTKIKVEYLKAMPKQGIKKGDVSTCGVESANYMVKQKIAKIVK